MLVRAGAYVRWAGLLICVGLLAACQSAGSLVNSQKGAEASPVTRPLDHITFPAPLAWGGEARCGENGCSLVLVEHEAGQLVLHQFKGRSVVELDRRPLAYHPDSAKWISDNWVVAAVERGQTLDIFRVTNHQLEKHAQLAVPFSPRDVVILDERGDLVTLLATPYSGHNVAVLRWRKGESSAIATSVNWCDTPWHPAVVKRAPAGHGPGVVSGCLDDKRVMYVDGKDWTGKPVELARFDRVARQVRPTPSGKWLYVALELGPTNARIDMDTGKIQRLEAAPNGAVSVAPLDDDTVVWGGPSSMYIQKFDAAGSVLSTRWLKPSGYPTGLQLIDLTDDGEKDLLVLNSAGKVADVYFGPLWANARENP